MALAIDEVPQPLRQAVKARAPVGVAENFTFSFRTGIFGGELAFVDGAPQQQLRCQLHQPSSAVLIWWRRRGLPARQTDGFSWRPSPSR